MNVNMTTLPHLSKNVNMCDDGDMSLPLTVTVTATASDSACCVPRVTDAVSLEDAERAAMVFKALGDATRVRLISLIAAGENGEACICDLTEPVGLSQGTVSHHMKLLVDAGLVTREQRGRWAYFALDHTALSAAADALKV